MTTPQRRPERSYEDALFMKIAQLVIDNEDLKMSIERLKAELAARDTMIEKLTEGEDAAEQT